MSNSEIITLRASRGLRFEGSLVSGTVNFNTVLAQEKNVTAVHVSLRGEIHTYVFEESPQSQSSIIAI